MSAACCFTCIPQVYKSCAFIQRKKQCLMYFVTDVHLGEQIWCQMGRWESLEIHVENGY